MVSGKPNDDLALVLLLALAWRGVEVGLGVMAESAVALDAEFEIWHSRSRRSALSGPESSDLDLDLEMPPRGLVAIFAADWLLPSIVIWGACFVISGIRVANFHDFHLFRHFGICRVCRNNAIKLTFKICYLVPERDSYGAFWCKSEPVNTVPTQNDLFLPKSLLQICPAQIFCIFRKGCKAKIFGDIYKGNKKPVVQVKKPPKRSNRT